MPISKILSSFLTKNKIKYELLKHRTVYTALDKAATLKVKPELIGKTVIVSLDGKNHALGLIPTNKNLDKKKTLVSFNKLKQKLGKRYSNILQNVRILKENKSAEKSYRKIDFATEKWMKANIKGVKLGATPPFGTLYKLPFFIDNALTRQSKIIVNAGEYELSLKLSPATLIKLDPNTIKGSFAMAKK